MDDKVVFSVTWFDILARAVDGSASPYYVLRTHDYVTVLAATEQGSFLLVRQYRPAVNQKTLELPSGHVEDGETPEAAARRELTEETGYEAECFELLGSLAPDTGRLANRLWCFYARNATKSSAHVQREEGIELVECELPDLFGHVINGSIDHALHMGVLLLAAVRGKLSVPQSGIAEKQV
jgi:ADP-ribose pyrophosphatase